MKKKTVALSILLCFVLAGFAGAIQRKEFEGRSAAGLAPIYQNDGDTFGGFAVTCSSTAWTAVSSARDVRRRLYIQMIEGNLFGVCIATTTAAGTACVDGTGGIELSTGSYKVPAVELFTEAALNCRARAGSAGEDLKGYESYDSGD